MTAVTRRFVKGAALCALTASIFLEQEAAAETHEERARAHFQAGLQSLDAHDYAQALGEFRAAWALWQNAKILLNIGTCLRELGRDAEAANAYARYLAAADADPARKPEVADALRRIDAAVGKLVIRANQADTRVVIDGAENAEWKRDEPLRVAPGAHTVVGERAGFAPAVATVAVAAGETRAVELSLSPNDASPASRTPAPGTAGVAAPSFAGTPGTAEADHRIRPEPAPVGLSHANQFGAFVRVDIDGKGRGAVVAPGVAAGIGDYVELAAAGLIGRDKGGWLGAKLLILRGAWKPSVLVATPIFVVDGARVGVQGAAGLLWDPSSHFGAFVDFGIVHFPSPPPNYDKTVFLPSVGVQARL